MVKTIIITGEDIFLSSKYLEKCEISKNTIYNGKSRNHNGLSMYWVHFKDRINKNITYFKYSSIPIKTRKKLPSVKELRAIVRYEKEKKDLDKKNLNQLKLYTSFEIRINDAWTNVVPIYQQYFHEFNQIRKYCRTHIAFELIINLKKFGYSYQEIYSVYKDLDDLIFNTKSLDYFAQKLNTAKNSKIENVLLHGLNGKESNNKKITIKHVAFIKTLYINPRKYSIYHIHKQLGLFCDKHNLNKLTISSVKRIINDDKFQNECNPIRHGHEWAKKYLLPNIDREDPKYPGDVWQMDGTTLQFFTLNEYNKSIRYDIFAIMDVHSRKIIGYSLDENENCKMIFEALESSCISTGYFPSEIVFDNFSAFHTEAFVEFENQLTLLGVRCRRTKVNQPEDKGHIESFFKVFQSKFCKYEFGYIGDGIRSKDKNGKPAPELINHYLKKKNTRNKEQLDDLIKKLVSKYNNTRQNEKPSPITKFNIKEPKHIIKLSKEKIAYLFYKKKRIKVLKSTVKMIINNSIHKYTFHDESLSFDYNNKTLIIAYKENNLEKIYLFDPLSKKHIITLYKDIPVPVASIYHTKQDKQNIIKHAQSRSDILNMVVSKAKRNLRVIGEEKFNDETAIVINSLTKKTNIKTAETNEILHKHRNRKEKKEKALKSKKDIGIKYEYELELYNKKATFDIIKD